MRMWRLAVLHGEEGADFVLWMRKDVEGSQKEKTMSTSVAIKAVRIVLVCVGIHFGLSGLLPLIVFGCGLGFLFLP